MEETERKLIPRPRLKGRTDGEIIAILRKNNYDWRLCEEAVRLLKSEIRILNVVRKTKYDLIVCLSAINCLKSGKSIWAIMKATDFRPRICQEVYCWSKERNK